jgi:hypothetical protein
MREVGELKKFLLSDPKAKLRLTILLGLSSTSTIEKWVKKKSIPKAKLALVLKLIRQKGGDSYGIFGPGPTG